MADWESEYVSIENTEPSKLPEENDVVIEKQNTEEQLGIVSEYTEKTKGTETEETTKHGVSLPKKIIIKAKISDD